MKTRNNIHLILAALTFGLTACTNDLLPEQAPTAEPPAIVINDSQDAVQGQILVKFRPEVSKMLDNAQVTRSAGTAGCITRSGISSVDQALDIIRAYRLERIFPQDKSAEERTRQTGLHLWYIVHFDEEMNLDDAAADLSQLGEVSKIEFNHVFQRNWTGRSTPMKVSQRPASSAAAMPFDDEYLDKQWHYINRGEEFMPGSIPGADVNCLEAWKTSTGDPSIIVAVMDEGVDWSHPDLQANLWTNERETYRSNEDNDGNGYAGDYFGYNFSRSTGLITVDNVGDSGHGTHVAGTIAATNNNGIGVCGIAGGDGTPNSGVKIMSLQIYSGSFGTSVANQAKAVKYAADNGAVILQCSWGYLSGYSDPLLGQARGPKTDEQYTRAVPLLKEALDYFIHNAGSPNGVMEGGLVVFASGNESAPGAGYPAAYGDYVSVAAMTGDYSPASYTNYGYRVDITAPGGDAERNETEEGGVLSTMPRNIIESGYGYMEGTSMACPHVSGVAALGLSYAAKLHKHFRSKDYKELLLRSVKPIDEQLTGMRLFHYRWSLGVDHPSLVDISTFRGKMGSGVADAGILLANIDNEGVALVLPNAYVAVGDLQTIDPTRCFTNGETTTFSAVAADAKVASVRIEKNRIVIEGHKVGRTSFSVTSEAGETQTAFITVRKQANDNGWF